MQVDKIQTAIQTSISFMDKKQNNFSCACPIACLFPNGDTIYKNKIRMNDITRTYKQVIPVIVFLSSIIRSTLIASIMEAQTKTDNDRTNKISE